MMGFNAASSLRRAGFELIVYDIRPEAAEPLVAKGALRGATPADVLNRSDVVVTMVFGPKQIADVLRGPEGFLSTECAGKIWVDMTTSSPKLMRELAAEFRTQGGRPVDAPVTGSVDSAIRGDMLMFVGGEDVDIAAAKPVIEAMGVIRRVGQYGNGYVAKLVNNQLWKIHAAAIGEAMVTAKLAGLEPAIWWEAMKGGAADSFVLSHDVPSIFAGHYDPSFPLALCLKDLALIQELIADTGARHELTDVTHARFREARDRYGDAAGEMTVCKLIEEDAGVSLRVAGDWTPPWEAQPPAG
jgi:3-hydroxyisobutyrate dehydrogenase-like beta-hydroxyacid dehydrogenase